MSNQGARSPMDEVIGFLDQDETPETVDSQDYRQSIVPIVEEATELEHPEDFDILRYESGRQLMYDVLSATADSILDDDFKDLELDPDEIDVSWRENPKLKLLEKATHGLLWVTHKALSSYADRVMGVADLDMLDFDPERTPDMGYVTSSIDRFAEKHDIDYETAEAYVKLHEGIHLAQMHQFPELRSQRMEMMENDTGAIEIDVFNSNSDLQGLMSAIEGHAEFYTNQAFNEAYDVSIDREGGLKKKLLKKVHPLYRLSQSQYDDGSEFVEELHEQGGKWLTSRALENPPEASELDEPDDWISRTNPYHGQTYEDSWDAHMKAEGLDL